MKPLRLRPRPGRLMTCSLGVASASLLILSAYTRLFREDHPSNSEIINTFLISALLTALVRILLTVYRRRKE